MSYSVLLQTHNFLSVSFPTEHYTILEPLNPSIAGFEGFSVKHPVGFGWSILACLTDVDTTWRKIKDGGFNPLSTTPSPGVWPVGTPRGTPRGIRSQSLRPGHPQTRDCRRVAGWARPGCLRRQKKEREKKLFVNKYINRTFLHGL